MTRLAVGLRGGLAEGTYAHPLATIHHTGPWLGAFLDERYWLSPKWAIFAEFEAHALWLDAESDANAKLKRRRRTPARRCSISRSR